MYLKSKNYFLNLCSIFMLLGVLMGLNNNSWLLMWLSMEITLMFFIPKLILNKSMMESFSCLKYFIFQCLGSIFFILGSLDFFNLFFIFGLYFKMGLFPNHFWLLSMFKNMSWLNYFYLMTIQKILPLIYFVISLKFNMFLMFFLIFLNSIIGNLGSLNQMDLRLLMGFSSMNHMSWMLISSNMNMMYFYIYMIIYMIMMFYLYFYMNKMNIFYLFQIFYNNLNKIIIFVIMLLMLSFLGFPPLLGFMLKMMTLMSMMNFYFIMWILIMLMYNIIISFSYMRVIMFFLFNSSRSNKLNLYYMNYKMTYFVMIFMILL